MTSHSNCTHANTKKARAACRRDKVNSYYSKHRLAALKAQAEKGHDMTTEDTPRPLVLTCNGIPAHTFERAEDLDDACTECGNSRAWHPREWR